MDPLLRQQVDDLRENGDAPLSSSSGATILEVLVEVREQTTKTNGRVTALEAKVAAQPLGCPGTCNTAISQIKAVEARLDAIEKPAQTISILWKTAGVAMGHAVVILGLIAAFMATPWGEAIFEKKAESTEAIVAKVLAEERAKQAQPPAKP
jgi:hypothetical protein